MVHYSNLPNDIIRYLCRTIHVERLHGLISLSHVDKRTRNIALSFIFNHVFLSWPSDIMESLPGRAIISSVRILDVAAYDKNEEKLPPAFFTLLFSFPRLSTLLIRISGKHKRQVQHEFSDRSKSDASMSLFPSSLNSLVIPNRGWMFVTDYISKLENLVIDSQSIWEPIPPFKDDIERLGAKHPGLKKLSCHEDLCVTENVQDITRSFPDLQEIGLFGGMGHEDYGPVTNHLLCYRALSKLERISFPHIVDLDLGFRPPWCGTTYIRNPGHRNEVAAKEKKIIKRFLESIQQEIMAAGGPQLQTVVIDDIVYACDSKGRFRKSRIIRYTGRNSLLAVEEAVDASEGED